MEEIVEDAIEERRQEAEAAAAAAAAVEAEPVKSTRTSGTRKSKTTKKRANKKTSQEKAPDTPVLSPKLNEQSSLWPDASEEQDAAAKDVADAFPAEPSMEEFFDSEIFGDPMEPEEQPEPSEAAANLKEGASAASQSEETESSKVLLSPRKKSASKSKRPKIRPSLRKKKK